MNRLNFENRGNIFNVNSFPQLENNQEISKEKLNNNLVKRVLTVLPDNTSNEQKNRNATKGVFSWTSIDEKSKKIYYRDEGFSHGGLGIKDFACRVFEKLGWIQKISFQANRTDNMVSQDSLDPSSLTPGSTESLTRSVYVWREDRNKFEKDFLTNRMKQISTHGGNFVMIRKGEEKNSTEGTLLYKKDATIRKLHYTETDQNNSPRFFRLFNRLINKNTSYICFNIGVGDQKIFLSPSDAKTFKNDTGISPVETDDDDW